jgi:hypothetical protein
MSIRWVSAWCAIGFLAVLLGFLDVLGQVDGLRGRVSQLERHAVTVQAQAARQHGADQAALSAATARIGGAHRDLITCADIAELQRGLSVTGTDSMGGSVFSVLPGQPWLPAHCINQ